MEQVPSVGVAVTADRYQEAADLIEANAIENNRGDLAWAACINAALAVEIYLKSFLAKKVLTATGTGINRVTQKTERGHDLMELYQKISPDIRVLILSASHEIEKNLDLESRINHCKDYFFHARYSYEIESLPGLNSDIVVLARHMRKVVRKVAETTH